CPSPAATGRTPIPPRNFTRVSAATAGSANSATRNGKRTKDFFMVSPPLTRLDPPATPFPFLLLFMIGASCRSRDRARELEREKFPRYVLMSLATWSPIEFRHIGDIIRVVLAARIVPPRVNRKPLNAGADRRYRA